jgi:malate dehydrogenase
MDVAVIGASGTIGRQIVISLVQEHALPSSARIQLVGRRGGSSERILPAMAADLADAYAETMPNIEVILEADAIQADIIIVAVGQTIGTGPAHLVNHPPDRLALGRANFPILETYAQAIATKATGEELILIVTNPVELGVYIFSQHHPRSRVIGMGAFLDTLRFRREIAAELGIRRQNVRGLVLGEHGISMVPCWSTVSAYGFNSLIGQQTLQSLKRNHDPDKLMALNEIMERLVRQGPEAAYQRAAEFSADLRTFVKPFITHCSGTKTPIGVAEIITRLVETIVMGNQILAAAQVVVNGEFLDIEGVTGVPVLISSAGIRIEQVELWTEEAAAIHAAAMKFNHYLPELEFKMTVP